VLDPSLLSHIRKVAAHEQGRLAFESLTSPEVKIDTATELLLQKAAEADPVLLKIAFDLAPKDPMSFYRKLEGRE